MGLNVIRVIPKPESSSSVVYEKHTHAFPAQSRYRKVYNVVLNDNF